MQKRGARKNQSKISVKTQFLKEKEYQSLTNGQSFLHNKRKLVTALPPFIATPIVQFTRRYINSAALTDQAITIQQLFDSHLVAVSTILAYPIYRALRIRKIRFLAPVTTQGTSVTLAVTPVSVDSANNNFVSLPETYVDTSASIDRPAYLCLTPSISTPLGSWHLSNTTTNNILTIQAPPGTTMDIMFEGVMSADNDPLGYSVAIAGGSAGKQYARAVAINMVPVGINTI